MNKKSPIDRAIRFLGSMQALATGLGITRAAVYQWKLPGRKVPVAHCPAIERLTAGSVRCEELRPDVDWACLRKMSSTVEADGRPRALKPLMNGSVHPERRP